MGAVQDECSPLPYQRWSSRVCSNTFRVAAAGFAGTSSRPFSMAPVGEMQTTSSAGSGGTTYRRNSGSTASTIKLLTPFLIIFQTARSSEKGVRAAIGGRPLWFLSFGTSTSKLLACKALNGGIWMAVAWLLCPLRGMDRPLLVSWSDAG